MISKPFLFVVLIFCSALSACTDDKEQAKEEWQQKALEATENSSVQDIYDAISKPEDSDE